MNENHRSKFPVKTPQEYLLEEEELSSNSEPRVPIIVCVDCSFSMRQQHRLERVLEGLEDFCAMTEAQRAARLLQRCLEELERQTPPIYELASTLLFFAADAEGTFLAGHLGDGVFIQVQDGEATVVSPPENGVYQNETHFITAPDAPEHLRLRQGRLHGHGAEADKWLRRAAEQGQQEARRCWHRLRRNPPPRKTPSPRRRCRTGVCGQKRETPRPSIKWRQNRAISRPACCWRSSTWTGRSTLRRQICCATRQTATSARPRNCWVSAMPGDRECSRTLPRPSAGSSRQPSWTAESGWCAWLCVMPWAMG